MDEMTYKKSGVDIDAGNQAVIKMKPFVEKTFRKEVLTSLGGFSGLFKLDQSKYKEPVLVSGTDGVGTKLKIAFEADIHNTVGIDLVAMCVNDILTCGAEPLFFLDYIATGKINPDKITEIVSGISEGCIQSGMALLGGETAEMPDMYQNGEYDLAGFAVGVVEKEKIIDGSRIQEGDILLGLPSTGFHSNGYSLIRKVLFHNLQFSVHDKINEFDSSLKQILLTPTKIYHSDIKLLKENIEIKGLAHITGGGLIENTMRVIPKGLAIKLANFDVPELFQWIQKLGFISDTEMMRVFNMGIGMVAIVSPDDKGAVLNCLGNQVIEVGKVVRE